MRATRDGVFRRIGLGHVTTSEFTRWFAVNAGLGMDAQIIASMEQQRTRGHRATPLRYFVTTVREYFGERALVTGEPRAANVRAETETTCLVMDRASFNELLW